jgi:hypothetical protein
MSDGVIVELSWGKPCCPDMVGHEKGLNGEEVDEK